MNVLMFAFALQRQCVAIRHATPQEERSRGRTRKSPVRVTSVRNELVPNELVPNEPTIAKVASGSHSESGRLAACVLRGE
jgi:hypothetical protein